MVYVLTHLPAGFPRVRRNLGGVLTDLAYRALDALLSDFVKPTARALAEFFERNKDTGSKTLRNLEMCGYVRRWKRSAGRGAWLNFAVITDEPFAWEHDPALAARMAEMEMRVLTGFQDEHRIEPHEADPMPPPTEQAPPEESPQVNSCPGSSDPTDSDTPNTGFSREENPLPPNCGKTVHKRRGRRKRATDPASFLERTLRRSPELRPHIPDALAILHGLGYAPPDRVKAAPVLARALLCGLTTKEVISWMTERWDNVRNETALRNWRVNQLALSLGLKPVFRRR